MKCPHCGSFNKDGAKFCKSCGSSINTESLDYKNKSKNKSNSESSGINKNTLIICVTVIIIAIIVVGAVIFMNGDSNSDSDSNISSDNSSNIVKENVNKNVMEDNAYTCKEGGVKFIIPSEGYNRDGVAIRFKYSGKNCEIEEVPEYEHDTNTKTFYEASFSQDYQGGEPYTLVVNNHPWTGVKIYKDGKWFHISMNTDDYSEAEELVSWMSNHNSWSSP